MAPLEALCSQTEAYWFYWGWSRVYERMQKYFTSNEMREAGLDLAEIKDPSLQVLDVGAGTGAGVAGVATGAGVGSFGATTGDGVGSLLTTNGQFIPSFDFTSSPGPLYFVTSGTGVASLQNT
mgnify:CR=1 FL=1